MAKAPGVWLAVTSMCFLIFRSLELFWTLARGFKVVLQRRPRAEAGATANVSVPGDARPLDFSLFYFATDEGSGSADKISFADRGREVR